MSSSWRYHHQFFANLARMDLDLDFCLSDLAEVGAGFQELLEIVGIDDLMNA